MSFRFITLKTDLLGSVHIDCRLCEMMSEQVFAFSQTSDLESKSRSLRPVSKCTA